MLIIKIYSPWDGKGDGDFDKRLKSENKNIKNYYFIYHMHYYNLNELHVFWSFAGID